MKKSTRTSKRILTLVLTIALLLAFAPALSVAATQTAAGNVYLEVDIMATSNNYLNTYPANGLLVMADTTYYSGLANRIDTAAGYQDAVATYDITGRGYTRLSGVFGRISGIGNGVLTVTAQDGAVLGVYSLQPEDRPSTISVNIPAGVSQVNLRFSRDAGVVLALANAFFEAAPTPPAPDPIPPTTLPLPVYTVTAVAANGGTVTGGGTYVQGIRATVQATANVGWAFTGWYINGTSVSTSPTYNFYVSRNVTVQARFTQTYVPPVTPINPGPALLPPPPGQIGVLFHGSYLQFDVPPQMVDGRVLVPIRAIFDALGAHVEWNTLARTVTATRTGIIIVLPIGSSYPTINGQAVQIDAPAIIYAGRALVPLRFVSQALGAQVHWDASSRVVTIT